ncbi:MAG: hypothetical protein HKP58_18860 [Desulfatitalea sp.]|nr:hypothetical protein [Desulfatitalea sp.]NNK02477.1 hypothetical protein [Desulfatitalea sp.]
MTKYFHVVLVLMFTVSFGYGCSPATYKIHPEFNQRCQKIGSYCLIKPDVEICQISAGGVREVRDDWCELGLANVIAALEKTLTQKEVVFKDIVVEGRMDETADEIRALYRAVSYSIRVHAIGGPNVFPDKASNFDYAIGPIDDFLNVYGCDALIIVYGSDEVSSGGRKAVAVLGLLAGAFTGVAATPRGAITAINFATIDADGNILWYNSKAEGGYDLRSKDSTQQLIDNVLAEYPRCNR